MVKELDKILIKIEALDVDPQPIPATFCDGFVINRAMNMSIKESISSL